MQTRLTRQLVEPAPQEPLLPGQLFLVHRVLPVSLLQTLRTRNRQNVPLCYIYGFFFSFLKEASASYWSHAISGIYPVGLVKFLYIYRLWFCDKRNTRYTHVQELESSLQAEVAVNNGFYFSLIYITSLRSLHSCNFAKLMVIFQPLHLYSAATSRVTGDER